LSFRGLQKQHVDSYNFFLEVKVRQIVLESIINRRVTTDADPSFLLEYTNIKIFNPTHIQAQGNDLKSFLLP
jgi:DNA-directed RNA polymerase III subunit RPC2